MKKSEELFHRHEYLSIYYAKKLYDLKKIAYEQDDILQDFRMKLYEVILAYGRSWSRYKQTGKRKPIPLRFYLKSGMSNHVYDYIGKIQGKFGANNANRAVILNGDTFDTIDFGVHNPNFSDINYEENTYVVNGVDLLANLKGREKTIYSMYLKGTSVKRLEKHFTHNYVHRLIVNQKNYLEQFKAQLLPENEINYSCVKYFQE
jgi:hypothetical protein